MRVSQEERDRSHERIIASAAKLLRAAGIAGASVAEVMQDAGLTHGGFYKHFESKEALLVAALDCAFDESFALFGREHSGAEARAVLRGYNERYLSAGHVASPAVGCPIAAVANDVARSAGPLRERFGTGVRRVVARLAQGMSGSRPTREVRAIRQLAMLAGAVMIARASDPDTARKILDACRDHGPV